MTLRLFLDFLCRRRMLSGDVFRTKVNVLDGLVIRIYFVAAFSSRYLKSHCRSESCYNCFFLPGKLAWIDSLLFWGRRGRHDIPIPLLKYLIPQDANSCYFLWMFFAGLCAASTFKSGAWRWCWEINQFPMTVWMTRQWNVVHFWHCSRHE